MSVRVMHSDCREAIKTLCDSSIDSGVMDPPYALTTKKRGGSGIASVNLSSPYGRSRIGTGNGAGGFMGQKWDTGDTAFDPEFWAEVLRVLKPGAHLLAFSGTRTYHRMACAIEDAGFEIRDQGAWCYGSGFPKSHNQHGEFEGWGTALKPAWEPICIARKPLEGTVAQNLAKWGVGALNIDGCRVHAEDATGGEYTVTRLKPGATLDKTGGNWRPEDGGVKFHGNMKPGRWPANIIHDGSPEVVALFPESDGQQGDVRGTEPSEPLGGHVYGNGMGRLPAAARGDSGSAARFFYTAKADADDRLGSKHPTVKPVDLMQYLVRLVTPKGGLVLDAFAGTGTTGEAAFREGMRAVLIEREEAYVADIHRRIELLMAGPDERKRSAIKEKIKDGRIKVDEGPLFGVVT